MHCHALVRNIPTALFEIIGGFLSVDLMMLFQYQNYMYRALDHMTD
jgi:hypothetical protein